MWFTGARTSQPKAKEKAPFCATASDGRLVQWLGGTCVQRRRWREKLNRQVSAKPNHSGALTISLQNAHPGLQVRTVGEVHAKNAYRSPLPTPLETRGIFDRTFPGEVRVKRDGTPLETVGPLLAGLLGPVDPRKMARKLGFLALRSAAFLFRDKELAEREGFEPSIRFCRILTFQASAFDHSATAPHAPHRCKIQVPGGGASSARGRYRQGCAPLAPLAAPTAPA